VLLDELVQLIDDPEVLAGVLAHEVGHITANHSARMVTRSALIAVGVGLVFGSDETLIEELGTLGSVLILSEQSQEFELEADLVSVDIIRKLDMNPRSVLGLLDKIEAACGNACSSGGFFSSHPSFAQSRANLDS